MASFNPPIRDWRSRTVWIVGASSGIGRALAQQLVNAGARVVVTARREPELRAITPRPWMCLPCDIGDSASMQTALTALRDADAFPDVVFWVAGVYYPMDSAALDLHGVQETFRINVLSAYHAQAMLVAHWKERRESRPAAQSPHWILVSSVAGYRGLPQAAAYGASKAALTYLAETSYLELQRVGIAVSVVNPGFVATRLTQKNNFRMPAMITPDEAARQTMAGLAKGSFEIHYPRRFTRWLKLLRLLPYALYFRIMRQAVPRPPHDER
ncbi:MAG: SDR family NAD(P)-dependent oxidoreductase [Burkholderiaceae bacterium]